MRMGITDKKQSKSRQKKPVLLNSDEPDKNTLKQVGGSISANLVDAIFSPKIKEVSTSQAEQYAEALLAYQDAKEDALNFTSEGDQSETNPDFPEPNVNSYLFGSVESREEILTILSETSSQFSTVGKSAAKWKVHANAAKFERSLDEKYGVFRPFITEHPEIEVFIRNSQRKYARGEYSPFRKGAAPVDMKTSIIILVIMQRNGVKMENLVLATTFFLVGLQPWALVLLVILGRQIFEGRKKKKIAGWVGDKVKTVKPYYAEAKDDKAKRDLLLKPVGNPISADDFKNAEPEGEETYDTMLVGSGPSTMYTAALLSRTGRTVLVVSPEQDASGCHSISESGECRSKISKVYQNVPFDVDANNVAHTTRQQRMLAPALCTDTDAQGGIRFNKIGTLADGFTSDILSIPGMGVDNRSDSHPFLLRAGGASNIAVDTATFLGDGWPDDNGIGSSTSAGYLAAASGINATASEYYVSKLLPDKANKMKKASSYQEASVRYASGFLDKILPLNAHVRSLMAGIGMKGENLPPSKTSMAVHVTNTSAQISPEGFTYPIGGPRALCNAFASVVEQNGGKVLTGVKVKEFLFEENAKMKVKKGKSPNTDGEADSSKPRCHGIKLVDDRVISVGKDEDSCVVSMLGFIPTFIFYMPDDIRTKYGLPAGLPALNERRPLLHFLVGLNGNADDLSVTGADWYRLPNASLAQDTIDPTTEQITQGLIGMNGDAEEDEEAKIEENNDAEADSESAAAKRDKRTKGSGVVSRKQTRRVKFDAGSSWMKVSFPSAKDPSWKETHGDITTCVITIEADDDFVQMFESKPKIFSNKKYGSGESSRLVEKVTKDLVANFPQLEDKIDFISLIGPIRKGLSHTPMRYAAKGIRPKTPYPGLFMGGSDLTVGDSFSGSIVSGWMAANAVLNYSFVDLLYLEKNITTDLIRFLKSPRKSGEENVAVPFQMPLRKKELPEQAVEEE